MSGKTFTVTMLNLLRERFEQWLTAEGFEMKHVPGMAENSFIVIPGRERMQILEHLRRGTEELRARGGDPFGS